jgi:integrase
MPKHKIEREEEIKTENWQKILTLAETLDFSNSYQTPNFQHWFSAVLAIDWLTGKRINEILTLHRKDIVITQTEIRLRFHVGKKLSKTAPIERQPFQKNRNINHKAVPYIQKYLEEYDKIVQTKEEYLFPAHTQPRTRNVNTTSKNGKNQDETRPYTYTDPGGYVYEENARFWLNKINLQLPPEERIYFHYGRHSIGIKLAYQGKSDIEIARILDETPKAALEYTKHAASIGDAWTKETE